MPVLDIRFYADADGQPGAPVCNYTVTIASATQVGWVGYTLLPYFELYTALAPPCVLENGWVSVAGAGAAECWFVWMSSSAGDNYCYRTQGTYSQTPSHDLALCLTTDNVSVYGACCDDATAQCAEGVAMGSCSGRFLPNGTCAAFQPACGAAVGACCRATVCELATRTACLTTPNCPGDLNCDGVVDFDDINPFVLALSGYDPYHLAYPDCNWYRADVNGDYAVNFDDINPFVAQLGVRCGGTWLGAETTCDDCPLVSIHCPENLPLTISDATCGRRNVIHEECLQGYPPYPQAIYELVITDPSAGVQITLNPHDTLHTRLLLDDQYPPSCDYIAVSTDPNGQPHSLGCLSLAPGTYFLMVDGYGQSSPPCLPEYDLTITACNPPVGRCCYADPVQCAVVARGACDLLQGRWDDPLDCNTPCAPLDWDDCGHADEIPWPAYDFVFSKTANTFDGPAAPCDKYGTTGNMQKDTWLSWTALEDSLAHVQVRAYDPNHPRDAVVVVRTNCDGQTVVACADQWGETDTPEELWFAAVAGTRYYFQVGYSGQHAPDGPGLFQFSVTAELTPAACCFLDGSCQQLAGLACFTQGGTYQGAGTTCASANCPQPTAGSDCGNPVQVTLSAAALPFVDHNTTRGRGNDYTHTCLGTFDSDEDILYRLNVTQPLVLRFTLNPHGTPYTGFAVSRSCPPEDCLFTRRSTLGNAYSIEYIVLLPGVYYLMVDSWLSPQGIAAFDLTIAVADTNTGACCVASQCYANKTLAECLGLGGSWWRNTGCSSGPCNQHDGDKCATPYTVDLPWLLPFADYPNMGWSGNDYCGTTCLGPYDGGRDFVYQLVVHDPLTLDIIVNGAVGGSVRAALSSVCPPVGDCQIIEGYARGVSLPAGTYYLLIDMWPYRIGSTWYDYEDVTVYIQETPTLP